jgi:Mitochondrial carrier protein
LTLILKFIEILNKKRDFMITTVNNLESPFWHVPISGIAAGIMDTTVNYPTYGLKIRFQSGQKINFSSLLKNPTMIYQGATVYASTIVPTTGIQIGLDHLLQGDKSPAHLSIFSAMFSGATGALYCTASEHIILTQQKLSVGQEKFTGPLKSFRYLLNNFGFLRLWTGYPANTCRDMIFATAMLRGPKIIDEKTKVFSKNTLTNRKSYAMGIITTGILCSLLSHPFDTISTKQQYQNNKSSMFSMAKKIYSETGFKGFYPGFLFRVISVTGSLFVMPTTSEQVKDYLAKTP